MKCPKCGSEMHLFKLEDRIGIKNLNETNRYPIRICNTCKYQVDKVRYDRIIYEKEIYQARLDKVLSKFIKVGRGYLWSYRDLEIFYNFEYETFAIKNELNIISLKTVESLLKDLEVTK